MAFTSEQAREAGRKGGKARRQKNITLERVEAELPAMDTPENVKARLELLINWGAAGLLPGVVLNAAVSGCRVWFQVSDLQQERERIKVLEDRIRELEAELRAGPRRVG